jgi:hypothetical protein
MSSRTNQSHVSFPAFVIAKMELSFVEISLLPSFLSLQRLRSNLSSPHFFSIQLIIPSPLPPLLYLSHRVRIYTFAIVRAVLFEVLRSLRPIQPFGSSTFGASTFEEIQSTPIKASGTFMSAGHTHPSSLTHTSLSSLPLPNSLRKNTSPTKRVQSPNSFFGTSSTSPPRATMKGMRRKNSGIEGWKLEKWVNDSLSSPFL